MKITKVQKFYDKSKIPYPKRKKNTIETVKRNPNSLEQNKLLHFRSRIRSLEAVMNDRITIPALNELNSHETRRNRVPNPRYHAEIEANGSFHAKLLLTLILPRCSPPSNEKSRVVVHRFRSPSFQSREWARFQRGLSLPRISFSSRRSRRRRRWRRRTPFGKGQRKQATRRSWKAIGSTRGHEGSPGSSDILMEART